MLAAGLLAGGSGFVNGDAAAYAAQAAAGDLGQRVVHLGWIAVAAALSPVFGDGLPQALDGLVTLAAAGTVALVGRSAGPRSAWLAAAVLLPVSAFAEVDVPWIALIIGAALVSDRRVSAGLAAIAVTVSPTSLLAVPWLALHRRSVTPLLAASVAVLALSVLTGGDWWWADRGVLSGPTPRPLRVLGSWVAHPWWVVLPAIRWRPPLAALGLLLLAPADVPTWAMVGVAAVLQLREEVRSSKWLGVVVAVGLFALVLETMSVRREDRVARHVAASLGPADGLVAPWTWGVRVSMYATGDPYGLTWRPPDGFVRDQQATWCAADLARVAHLPPGRAWTDGTLVDDAGVRWGERAPREGCTR